MDGAWWIGCEFQTTKRLSERREIDKTYAVILRVHRGEQQRSWIGLREIGLVTVP